MARLSSRAPRRLVQLARAAKACGGGDGRPMAELGPTTKARAGSGSSVLRRLSAVAGRPWCGGGGFSGGEARGRGAGGGAEEDLAVEPAHKEKGETEKEKKKRAKRYTKIDGRWVNSGNLLMS